MTITVEELSSPGCHICMEFEEFWRSIARDWPNVTYRKVDVTTPEGQDLVAKHMIFASPGIIVNGQLFATGGFHRDAFVAKLKQLSEQK